MILSPRSLANLKGVHPDLVKLVHRAAEITRQPFIITEGLRTLERQRQLLAAGASTTLKSRHLTGHAVDIACFIDADSDGIKDPEEIIRWDWPLYHLAANYFKAASKELSIPIVWGGDWKSFQDGPHFELARSHYPA